MTDHEMVLDVALALLKKESAPTKETIQKKVKSAIKVTREDENNRALDVDEDKLVRELETLLNNSWIGQATVLENQKDDHIPWLDQRKSEINWDFWERYRRYLEVDKGWGPKIVNGLDRLTDDVLKRLEEPKRLGTWDRRGMVVGQVQSGKTSHYTGLICKAADAGYKLIIVLSGLHNNLRTQTQIRLDKGFLGRDTARSNLPIGVGKFSRKRLIVYSPTTSADNGDFNTRVADHFGVSLGGEVPFLFVIKKHRSVLYNLLQWALSQGQVAPSTGKRLVRGVPLLVIDDEADNASINTYPVPPTDESGNLTEEYDTTITNGLIRRLLHGFEQRAYIGYTATPFANIYIPPKANTSSQGKELFPRNFIVRLPAPSNYIGPVKLFGLDADPALAIDKQGLPITRRASDADDWMPTEHKKDHIPTQLPRSLKEAMRAFILSCAVRSLRGQETKHNSMLVHVTRWTDVQAQVTQQIKDELTFLYRCLRYGEGDKQLLMEEFRHLWEADFVKTTQSIIETKVKTKTIDDPNIQLVSWQQVQPLLSKAASTIEVMTINGTAGDVLKYEEYEREGQGLNVIAIGGDKLSRGLTLEGLTVSYYLRASKMYDTLMQMGRWFGYKQGYLDLCRLYTTDELVDGYKHITLASEELLRQFDYMASSGATPKDFGLKVRNHPEKKLIVTAKNKMRTGTNVVAYHSKRLSETTIFYRDDRINQKNLQVTEELLRSLGRYSKEEHKNYIWTKVVAEKIIEFLLGYQSHTDCKPADTYSLIEYIEDRRRVGELVLWTVALISNQRATNKYEFAGLKVNLTKRKNISELPQQYRLSQSRLLSPPDELIDLPDKVRKKILEETNDQRRRRGKEKEAKNPSGPILRSKRSPENGLLLLYPLDPQEINSKVPVIGFVISFPNSLTAEPIEYRVNQPYLEQKFGQL